jgi:hypothetical protein
MGNYTENRARVAGRISLRTSNSYDLQYKRKCAGFLTSNYVFYLAAFDFGSTQVVPRSGRSSTHQHTRPHMAGILPHTKTCHDRSTGLLEHDLKDRNIVFELIAAFMDASDKKAKPVLPQGVRAAQ